MLGILITFCFIAGAFTKNEYGPCPRIPAEDVDISKMAGMWYQYEHSDNVLIEDMICARLIWYPPVDNVSKILFSSISASDNINSTLVSSCRLDRNTIILHLRLPVFGALDSKDHILETDYDNYAIVQACHVTESQHISSTWVLIRNLVPPKNIEAIVKNAFIKRGLQPPRLEKFNNEHC